MTRVTREKKTKAGGQPAVQPCSCCGIAPGPGGAPLSVTFEKPDVFFDIHPALLDTWGDDPFLALKNVGFFVRVVLPIKLADGFAVDFGTWLEVDADDFRNAWRAWNFPEYKDLALQGYLANVIAPWPAFPHALVTATVRSVDEVPVVTWADHPDVMTMLQMTWPHARILTPYAEILREPLPPSDVTAEATAPAE